MPFIIASKKNKMLQNKLAKKKYKTYALKITIMEFPL